MLRESQPSQLCTTWKDPSILIELLGNTAKILQCFNCVRPKRRFCILNETIDSYSPFFKRHKWKKKHIRKLLALQTWLCNCLQTQRIRVEQLASRSWSALHSFELQATKQSLGSNCHCLPNEAHRCKDRGKTRQRAKRQEKTLWVDLRTAG